MKESEGRRGVGRERKPRGGEGWRVNMVRERERKRERERDWGRSDWVSGRSKKERKERGLG